MKQLSPKNDFYRTVYIEDLNPATFQPVPVTSGTVTAFLATSNDPEALPADNSLTVNAAHVGVVSPVAGQYPLGTWGITIDASVLTTALLDSLFSTGIAFLIIQVAGGARKFERVKYIRSVPSDLA